MPIDNKAFLKSMASSKGVLCGAGFETPAEAMYLGKRLMVIPMKGQYEQQCNAAALEAMGIPVLKSLKLKHAEALGNWICSDRRVISMDFPDQTESIIDDLFRNYPKSVQQHTDVPIPSAKRLKDYLINKILARLAGS
jgi:predicted glycosyltransferase